MKRGCASKTVCAAYVRQEVWEPLIERRLNVDLGGQDEIAFRKSVDLMGPDLNAHLTPR